MAFAADGNEIDPAADIFLASKTNILTRNKVHWSDATKKPDTVVGARFSASPPGSPITSQAFSSDALPKCKHLQPPPTPPPALFPPPLRSQLPAASKPPSRRFESRSPPPAPPPPRAGTRSR